MTLECGGTDVVTLYLSGKGQFDLCTVLQNNKAKVPILETWSGWHTSNPLTKYIKLTSQHLLYAPPKLFKCHVIPP